MIPKIIHHVWLSGEKYSPEIETCLKSWEKFLPDFELRLWDMKAVRDIDVDFLQEAIACKKWAFAADYIRAYALYHYGGIYLDTDVMLYKSLTPLLSHKAFIGKETSIHFEGRTTSQYLTSHCFGAEKGHPFVRDCLEFYHDRHFELSKNEHLPPSLRYNYTLMPYIQSEIAKMYGYDDRPSVQVIQECQMDLAIYPSNYFDAQEKTEDTFCKHLALGAWRDKKSAEPIYNFRYKVEWRVIAMLQRMLGRYHYMILKTE